MYVTTHFTQSASEYEANGYTCVKLFSKREDAVSQLKAWRADELELREQTACPYEVYEDTDETFHCTWDSDLEGVFIQVHEVSLQQ